MIINAIPGGATVKLNNYTGTVPNNAGAYFSLMTGRETLYVWPQGDSLHPYFNTAKEIGDGDIYSLFLTGSIAAPEAVLVKEALPYRTDSTAGIRFINLSPNSTPLNITLSTTPTVNEVSNLGYKAYTEFKTYAGLYNSAYTFQVRAANNPNVVLTTFALTTSTVPRFASITVVIRGMVGVSPAIGTIRVNNDR